MSNVSRRDVLRAGAIGAAAVRLLPIAGVEPVRGAAAAARASVTPKAIIFDVFGTVVEWRSSIVAEATAWGKAHRIQNVDWTQFATGWRHGQENVRASGGARFRGRSSTTFTERCWTAC